MENSIMVLKKKGNQKGFSLVELLIVIAIMGVLAVIAFNAFNGVLVNSKKKSDTQQAKNIEKSLKLLATDAGVINFAAATGVFSASPTGAPLLTFGKDSAGLEQLITALQAPLYKREAATGKWIAYGPYLDNSTGTATGTYSTFAPQWNSDAGGLHTGYVLMITTSTNNIAVFPTEGNGTTANAAATSFVSTMNPGIIVN